MAHSWDIIAYTYDGSVYHADCLDESTINDSDMCHPVFLSDEFDLDGTVCNVCHNEMTNRQESTNWGGLGITPSPP